MYVAGLWRYPVKSLAGEALTTAQLTGDGICGDRIVHVAGPHGPLTGRTRLLTVPAATGPDGIPRVAGHPQDTSEAAARVVRAAAGPNARLAAYLGPEQQWPGQAMVIGTGTIRLGDPVNRGRTTSQPEHAGGWILGAPYRMAQNSRLGRIRTRKAP